MSSIGSGGGEDSFKLQAGDNIGRSGIAEGVTHGRVECAAAARQDNGADFYGYLLFTVFEIDGIGRAEFFATAAFAANEINALGRIDAVFERHGLGILNINGLAFVQPRVIGIGHFAGTFFGAGAAGNAFFHVHVSRALGQTDFKVAFFTGNACDLRECQQFDIDVPADLDQFRRDDSHGAVIGGECFVQLGHHAPDRT